MLRFAEHSTLDSIPPFKLFPNAATHRPRRGGVTGCTLWNVANRMLCCHLRTSKKNEDHLRKIWDRVYGSVSQFIYMTSRRFGRSSLDWVRVSLLSPDVTYQSFQSLVMMVSLQVHLHASILIRFIFMSNVSAYCYWPNGESSHSFLFSLALVWAYTNSYTGTDRNAGLPANRFLPCDPNASARMCCAQDPSSPFLNVKSGVDCCSDGLCADAGNDVLWRAACTDYTWQSPEFIKLCINGTNEAGNDIQIMQRSDGRYEEEWVGGVACEPSRAIWVENFILWAGAADRELPKVYISEQLMDLDWLVVEESLIGFYGCGVPLTPQPIVPVTNLW